MKSMKHLQSAASNFKRNTQV